MATSKVDICNVSLAMLGADSIRTLTENNKRARMASAFFDFTRDYILAKVDWSFARKYVQLQPLDQDDYTVPDNLYVYSLPSDCHVVRDMHPPGSKDKWHVMGRLFYCESDTGTDVYIYYTAKITDITIYSSAFNNLLALGLAVKMGPALTQDKQLVGTLQEQFMVEQVNAWETDANIGNQYRAFDEDPNNDTFVYPDGYSELDSYRSNEDDS